MEFKGQRKVIGTCHLLNPVVGLEVDGFRVHLGEVLREKVLREEVPKEEVPRGEAKMVEDKIEAFHREARFPLPK